MLDSLTFLQESAESEKVLRLLAPKRGYQLNVYLLLKLSPMLLKS